MILAIIALVFSFAVMVALVATRSYEMNVGQRVVMVPARVKCDNYVQFFLHNIRIIVQVASTKKFWTGLLTFIWNKMVEKIWHHPRVEKAKIKAVDIVRGKKEIKSKGPVSFYLKDVSEYKKDTPM